MGKNTNLLRKVSSLVISFTLLFQQMGFAQVAAQIDLSGYLSGLKSNFTQDVFRPAHLRYFSYDNSTDNFKLLLEKGDFLKSVGYPAKAGSVTNTGGQDNKIKQEAKELLKYFLTGISLPDDMFWVNLRPDSRDQVIDNWLEKTDVGKIMLEADLQLKKDTAMFTSPDTSLGRKYWNRLYKKAAELYGYDNITIPTLTRPWIVPGEIIVRETMDEGRGTKDEGRGMKDEGRSTTPSAYIYKATLKVMLEEDYLKYNTVGEGLASSHKQDTNKSYEFNDPRAKELNTYSTELIREMIIPKLTKEINSSKRYASLRQVYYSLILSRWFKMRFSGKQGAYSSLINSSNLTNLTSQESWSKNTYFKQYQKSFSEGEYNIKEPVSTPTGQVIRSYFSGGLDLGPGNMGINVLTNGNNIIYVVSTMPGIVPMRGAANLKFPDLKIMPIGEAANKEFSDEGKETTSSLAGKKVSSGMDLTEQAWKEGRVFVGNLDFAFQVAGYSTKRVKRGLSSLTKEKQQTLVERLTSAYMITQELLQGITQEDINIAVLQTEVPEESKITVCGNWKLRKDLDNEEAARSKIKEFIKAVAGINAVRIVLYVDHKWAKVMADEINQAKSKILLGAQTFYFDADQDMSQQIQIAVDTGYSNVMIGHSMQRFYNKNVLGEVKTFSNTSTKPLTNEDANKINKAIVSDGRLKLHYVVAVDTLPNKELGDPDKILDDSEQVEYIRQQVSDGVNIGLDGINKQEIANIRITVEPNWAISTKTGDGKVDPKTSVNFPVVNKLMEWLMQALSDKFGHDIAQQIDTGYGASASPETAETLLEHKDIRHILPGGKSLEVSTFFPMVVNAYKGKFVTPVVAAVTQGMSRYTPVFIESEVISAVGLLSIIQPNNKFTFTQGHMYVGLDAFEQTGNTADLSQHKLDLLRAYFNANTNNQSADDKVSSWVEERQELIKTIVPRLMEYDVRGIAGPEDVLGIDSKGKRRKINLTPAMVEELSMAYGWNLRNNFEQAYDKEVGNNDVVIVTGATELSKKILMDAAIKGLTKMGINVRYSEEPVSTGANKWYYNTFHDGKDINVIGSFHFTGSHNPRDENGIKIAFTDAQGIIRELYGKELNGMASVLERGKYLNTDITPGESKEISVLKPYEDAIVEHWKPIFDAFREKYPNIPIRKGTDTGYGVMGPILQRIYKRIGIKIFLHLHAEPNGYAIDEHGEIILPDTSKEAYLKYIEQAMKDYPNDVASAYDRDGDRIDFNVGGKSATAERLHTVRTRAYALEHGHKFVQAGENMLAAFDVRASGIIKQVLPEIEEEVRKQLKGRVTDEVLNNWHIIGQFIPTGYVNNSVFATGAGISYSAYELDSGKVVPNQVNVGKYVQSKAKPAEISMEASCHAFEWVLDTKRGRVPIDDGAFAGLAFLMMELRMRAREDPKYRSTKEALEAIPILPITPDLRLNLPEDITNETKFGIVDKAAKAVIERHKEEISEVNLASGWRIIFKEGGFLLLRGSNTGAKLSVKAEAKTAEELVSLMQEAKDAYIEASKDPAFLVNGQPVSIGTKELDDKLADWKKKDSSVSSSIENITNLFTEVEEDSSNIGTLNVSSSLQQAPKNMGAIDFRGSAMNINYQAMGSFKGLDLRLPQLSRSELKKINIDSEIQQIKKMVNSGISPSGRRMLELAAACEQKGRMSAHSRDLLLCVVGACELAEINADESSLDFKKALVFIDSRS
ncbi:MAG: triose-phosphate isomerase [Candidatus Omnitrophota bacterium]